MERGSYFNCSNSFRVNRYVMANVALTLRTLAHSFHQQYAETFRSRIAID